MVTLNVFLYVLITFTACADTRSYCKVRFKALKDKAPSHASMNSFRSQNRSLCVQELINHQEWKSVSYSKKDGCEFYNQTFKGDEYLHQEGKQYIFDGCEASSTCVSWLWAGYKQSDTYCISLDSTKYNVYCDMETDGGGWMVFQRRINGALSFNRKWQEYAEGFGDPTSEHWIGNHLLHALTSSQSHELRVNLISCDGDKAYANYGEFSVASEADKFKLHVADYSGTAGDSLINVPTWGVQHGMAFTTKDRDNDRYSGNCGSYKKAGWWYSSCKYAHPNGLFASSDGSTTIQWNSWKSDVTLCGTTLMMRPVGTV